MSDNSEHPPRSDSGKTTPVPDQACEDSAAAGTLRVDEPGNLIAALPAMLGFAPQRSLVVIVLSDSVNPGQDPVIDVALRFDLEHRSRRSLVAAYTQTVAQICAAEGARQVLAVIIDDRARPSRRTRGDSAVSTGPWAALIDAFARQLAREEIFLAHAWAVRAIQPQRRWWSLLDTYRHGRLPDPATSIVAVAHVLAGHPIRRDRSELTALVTPDHDLVAQVTAHLDSAHARAHERHETALRHGEPDRYHRRALELVLWQIADTDSGVAPTAPQCAQLAAALRDRTVRNSLLALAVGPHAAAAETLWAALTRALTGSDCANAAALLGYSAYIRGDGPIASVAFDAALRADPTHSMAILLETALRNGMRPETLRRLAYRGLGTAADLGIDLETRPPTSPAAPDHTAPSDR
ncbi:DUF4192 domain-containing protein [Nocardia sp. NPDC050793]|uniref:DUF4192 domain-containing protein n=1 Tax=Nocardia sp. NPDC050793 TaxID=3155159 RepID=UPI0033F4191F